MRAKLGAILTGVFSVAAIALLMAWLDGVPAEGKLRSWIGYVFLLLAGYLSTWAAVRVFAPSEQAVRLAWSASGLRLAIGVGLMLTLPVFGYAESEVTRAGYFYFDTAVRDQMAWRIASQGLSILDAFKGLYPGDQYGGMLALSAGIYRLFSPDFHRPFLVLIITSFATGWGVLAAWAAARLFISHLDEESPVDAPIRFPLIAAGIVAFFPEGVILGATHMREAFVIPALTVALVGFAELTVALPAKNRTANSGIRVPKDGGSRSFRPWVLAVTGLGVTLFFQPSLALAGVIALGGLYLVLDFVRRRYLDWRTALLMTVAGAVLIAVITTAWGRMAFSDSTNPVDILSDWLLFNLQREGGAADSDQVRSVLGSLPLALRSLALSFLGLLQPFLPAAAFSTGNAFWRTMGGIRATGWYLLLPLFVYAMWASFRGGKPAGAVTWRWITLWVWGWSWFSALRAGGDVWDNPRYRAMFLGIQGLLAAWVLVQHGRTAGLRRVILVEASMVVVFCAWYIGRYILPWLYFDFVVAIMGGVILSIAALATDWVISKPDLDNYGAKE